MRQFRYVGEPMMTRGDYGVRIDGGHESEEDPGFISVFDPDFGDMVWAFIGAKDWEEVTE